MKKFSTQPTIDSFFGNNNSKINPESKIELKRYFYLDWSEKYSPIENAYWTDIKPEKINYIDQVKCDYIKKGYYFYICGNFAGNDEREFYFAKDKVYKNTSFLKSLLQKSVRKMNGELAVQSCYHLFKMDFNDLIRRLPIIMLEDTSLHESFTTLVWLMIAIGQKNKFSIKQYIYEWLLGIVYMMSVNILNYDDIFDESLSQENDSGKTIKLPVYEILNTYNTLSRDQMSILYCIHLRIAYGGMPCDIDMLNKYSQKWFMRFSNKGVDVDVDVDIDIDINNNNQSILHIECVPICIYIKDLELSEWDISAIDYHCSPKMIELISKKYDEIDETEIKRIIWCHSSAINNRKKSLEYNSKLWLKMKPYIERTQKYLLESGY